MRPGGVSRGFKLGQVVSGGLLALSHGTNDAQKTMGLITLALVASGKLSAAHFHVPLWVVVAAATAISLGTFTGGWRIIKTMGTKIISMDRGPGLRRADRRRGRDPGLHAAADSHSRRPMSSPAGSPGGAGKRLSAVRWGVAGEIVTAWVLTLPCAALVGGLAYGLVSLFGSGDTGPIVLSIVLVLGLVAIFRRARGGRGRGRQLATPAIGEA